MRHKSPVNRNIGLCRYGSRVKTLTLFTWTGPGCFTFRLRLLLWWWWRWLLSGWEICRLLIGRFTQSLRAQCPAAKLQPSSATGLHQTGAVDYLKTKLQPSRLFEDQVDFLKTSLKTRRLPPVLNCLHLSFPTNGRQGNIISNDPDHFSQSFSWKDKYNCFCKLANKMWSSMVFLQMTKIIFLDCPLAKRMVSMRTVRCGNYLCKFSGSSSRW